ncbi:MAG: UMP kinase [Thermoplasmata archaeon]|nr:UMP kinase [Thermoplasmata archaeon]
MPTLSDPPKPTVVLSVGGSVLVTGDNDVGYLRELATLLKAEGQRSSLAVTTGGGRTAREYIRIGRELGLTEVELDDIGIDVTRLHARLLAAQVGPPTPTHVPATIAQAVHELHHASPVILGGTEPGHTTDGVAALLAVRLRAARLVNATNVDGVYDRDPRTFPGAHRIDVLDWASFGRMVAETTRVEEAGQQAIFDRLGAGLLARARIPLSVVHGRDLKAVRSALRGEKFVGTRIG